MKIRTHTGAVLVAMAALATPTVALAQSTGEAAASEVVRAVQAFDALATRTGRLATRHGSDAPMRRYGDRLIRDAHRLDTLVQRYARAHRVSTAAANDPNGSDVVQQLEQLSGVAFDQVMLTETASSEQHAILELGRARERIGDAELLALVDAATTALQQDHEMAIALERAR